MTPTIEQFIEELLLAWQLLGVHAQQITSIEVTLPDGAIVLLR